MAASYTEHIESPTTKNMKLSIAKASVLPEESSQPLQLKPCI